MENRSMKRFLRYLRNKDVLRKYEMIFDKRFDFNSLLNLSESDVNEIICDNDYLSAIKLYEVVNNIKINEDIKEYIFSLEDREVVKYCLRLAVSSFDDENKKFEFINALGESKSESVRFAYGVCSNKSIVDNEHGIDYVRIVGNCKEDVASLLVQLLYEDKFLEDKDLLEFLNAVKEAREEYIARYMIELFKNENTDTERIPVEYMSVLLCSQGIKQAEYAYKTLTDENVLKRSDAVVIALSIAVCDDSERAYKGLIAIKDEEIINRKDAGNVIINIIGEEIIYDNLEYECEVEEVLKSRNLDEILKSLSTIPDTTEINGKVKVKSTLKK